MNMKIADVERRNRYIMLKISASFGLKSIFHNICSTYFSPNELIDKDIELFSNEEKSLIYACASYNNAVNIFEAGAKVESTICFGEYFKQH
ncbi:hypothetical protein [Facilibium subflavum]|uniref:hypothetical protein n=1 Tax=Facilibium subflavum TaxID=2219058 RepID=UPI000E64AF2D|nr:hypothetical protein [Facilibium subflavum]